METKSNVSPTKQAAPSQQPDQEKNVIPLVFFVIIFRTVYVTATLMASLRLTFDKNIQSNVSD